MVTVDPLVRVRDLRYRYPGADCDVLRIPFLDITGRGMIAITGPSGAGKSTLIELLAGTLRGDYQGTVEVLGQEWSQIRRDADRQRHLRRIGLIPQDYGLLPDRSIADLLGQDLRDADIDRRTHRQRIAGALAEVGLTGFEDRQVAALSGGQRQRVAIARMLARDVDLVIADEPTANLDPNLTGETIDLFRRLAENTPVLIITHDPSVAAGCDRTIVLQSAVPDPPAEPRLPAGRGGRRSKVAAGLVGVVVLVAAMAGVALSFGNRGHPHHAGIAAKAPVSGSNARSHKSHRTAATSQSAATTPRTVTAVRAFSAWTASGSVNPDLHIAAHVTGQCFSQSLSLPDAYRCMAGNTILDPCFAPSNGAAGRVVCAQTPWSPAYEMTVEGGLPSATPASGRAAVWAIQLANGARCSTLQHLRTEVGGEYLVYGCGATYSGASAVSSQKRTWTVGYDPGGTASTLTTVAVAVAWDYLGSSAASGASGATGTATPNTSGAKTATTTESVPVVACNTSYGATPPSPKALPATVTVTIPSALTGRVLDYTDQQMIMQILGPAGWNCLAAYGGDGSGGVSIYPPSENMKPFGPPPPEVISGSQTSACSGCKLTQACALFPQAATALASLYPGQRCYTPSAEETHYTISSTVVVFADPPGAAGTGRPSGGPYPANGVMTYLPQGNAGSWLETCTLPQSYQALCSTSLDYFARRYGKE